MHGKPLAGPLSRNLAGTAGGGLNGDSRAGHDSGLRGNGGQNGAKVGRTDWVAVTVAAVHRQGGAQYLPPAETIRDQFSVKTIDDSTSRSVRAVSKRDGRPVAIRPLTAATDNGGPYGAAAVSRAAILNSTAGDIVGRKFRHEIKATDKGSGLNQGLVNTPADEILYGLKVWKREAVFHTLAA